MSVTSKTAVILFNLGGPSEEAAIEPFLFNFFMDKNVIQLPYVLRLMLAKWISWSRGRGAAKEAYGLMGGASPLLKNTCAQAEALEDSLQKKLPGAKVFVSMRYWHPFAEETARQVADFSPDHIVLLPLYPQFSAVTSGSSLESWYEAAARQGINAPTTEICCYPDDPGFIEASATLIQNALHEAPKNTRILFSAHGLPEKLILQGDPYQWQCEQTVAAIVHRLNMPLLDWRLCYQSKVGRLKWIGPSTCEALEEAADDQMAVIIYPCAFVSEHVETIVEIDMEYRHRALSMGIPYFAKVPTVGTHPQFIEGLRDLVLARMNGAPRKKICPDRFQKCCHGRKHG